LYSLSDDSSKGTVERGGIQKHSAEMGRLKKSGRLGRLERSDTEFKKVSTERGPATIRKKIEAYRPLREDELRKEGGT